MQEPETARQISKPLTVGALCPSARAVASTSPWLLWAEGSAVWVKNADSDPSPSQPGCLWNLEQRCNVRENSSCLDEARSASLSTGACLPQFTLPVYLSLCLSVSFWYKFCCCFDLYHSVNLFLLHSLSLHCLYTLCYAAHPVLLIWPTLSHYHPSLFLYSFHLPFSFISSVCSLFLSSPSHPCSLPLKAPLPPPSLPPRLLYPSFA